MSTPPEKSLRTSEDKDWQEKNSDTKSTKKEEAQKDERSLPYDLVKKIHPSDLRRWPILHLLKPEFIRQIRMIMIYGNYSNKALIVTKDKNVYDLDYNKDAHLKTSDANISLHPKKIEELCRKNIKTFACSTSFVLALTEEGEVYFWRINKKRKLAGSNIRRVITSKPRIVGLSEKYIVDIVCGSDHSLVLTKDGEVYAWGENKYGQLGNKNTDIFDDVPRQVGHQLEGKKIVHIACGSNFNVVVTDTGKLYGWGDNENGQISIDNAISSSTGICLVSASTSTNSKPIAINIPSATHPTFNPKAIVVNPTSISVNKTNFSFAVTSPLTVPFLTSPFSTPISTSSTNVTPSNFAFVSNNKTTSNNVESQKYYAYPHEIAVFGKVIVKVACGFQHALALTDKGKIYAWGNNVNGQVGVINTQKSCPPTLVNMPELVKDIAAYGDLSVAVSNNKTVYVWGDCFGRNINVPLPTEFSRIHDAFAYSKLRVMYKPLIVSTDDYEYVEEVMNVMKSLEAGFDDPSTSDCIIEVEGQRIHVHKAILQIRCQYFKNIFQHVWTKNDESIPVYYFIPDKFSYIVCKAFLKYLYTGRVDLPSENALDLMELADEYGETSLKRECSRIIEQTITTSNVIFLYSKAIEFNAKELEEFCFQFALCHMKVIVLSEEYIKLDLSIKDAFMRRAAEANAFRT